MKITFYGATREVTGSAFLLEACGKRILIDCGMRQGVSDDEKGQTLPFAAHTIDSVLLTHAHIDHSGRLPLLVKEGFHGQIHMTEKTEELITIMLRDSAFIQENDAKWANQKGKRAGKKPVEPLYTIADAMSVMDHVVPHGYDQSFSLYDGIEVYLIDAGHLLGSASIRVTVTENGKQETILFSGDIGNTDQPIIRNPQPVGAADYIVMESTYGDRNHDARADHRMILAEVIENTLARGGNVVIPSFAVGRTQEVLYLLREIKEERLMHSNWDFPVYVDSPLSVEATKIYSGDLTGYADEETVEAIARGGNPLRFPNLHLCTEVEESKQLNLDKTPKVIISSSGMCEAGRVRHHLKHNLWRTECSVVFVGYQAQGTLGRMLLDGVKTVKLFGEEVAVNAEIYNFGGLSAHADQSGMLKWLGEVPKKPKKVFLVHGENGICEVFRKCLEDSGYHVYIADYCSSYDLVKNELVEAGIPYAPREKKVKPSTVFGRLQAAGQHLLDVIRRNEGTANKDLAKFADQVNDLARKWER